MRIDAAQQSLIGARNENQDRVRVVSGPHAALVMAVDGMGGHREGARAAETAAVCVEQAFSALEWPHPAPADFLHRALEEAHAAVVALGADLPEEMRPRATCALALMQHDQAWWAHAGDSRVYLLRAGRMEARTRDHSHVERLFQQGLIEEREIRRHPLRHLVESCLGGDPRPPQMCVSAGHELHAGDVLLACTDGFWSGVPEDALYALNVVPAQEFSACLRHVALQAVAESAPHADNTSVCALRWWES